MPRSRLTWLERVKAWRWPGLASFRLRLFFRGVFLLLALATLGVAVVVLQDEKRLADRSYRAGFAKTMAQVSAQLRHPAGQLALLNPPSVGAPRQGGSAVHPLVLPFAALDFDDRNKVEQAVEMAGCSLQYPGGAALCVAIGSHPWAGGFVYVVGHLAGPPVVAHARGQRDLGLASRLRLDVALRGRRYGWTAPYEAETSGASMQRGHLAGFPDDADGVPALRPDRDFRGWLWQGGPCLPADESEAAGPSTSDSGAGGCPRRTSFSVRLPVDLLRDDVVHIPATVWPPVDLDRIDVRVRWLGPGDDAPLFDSARPGAAPPFSLVDLAPLLLPGETLQIGRAGAAPDAPPMFALTGAEPPPPAVAPGWLAVALGNRLERTIDALIRRLPVEGEATPVEATETIRTPMGSYVVRGLGDERSANRTLAAVATRVSWFVLAMLAALAFAWLAIEGVIIRRIAILATRSRAVTAAVVEESDGWPPRPARWSPLDIADLRGPDELGVLASNLAEALQRVAESAQRDRLRARQERDQWMAVGHEIMSPLQSLIALHGAPDDESRRYILRMQQAIRVLYGSASPSEAFQSTTLQLAALELGGFLADVATNAPHAGISDVRFEASDERVWVRADAYSLEDVITHVLQNADRHRAPGSPITLRLSADEILSTIAVHNVGEPIAGTMLERIFEYGVSGNVAETATAGAPQRGQGLFVARTYLAKMGGTIAARNVEDGVEFVMTLPRVPS